jgi:WD40 repeat protein/tRNA A-37 threonylcarbamoyl transferase component Bud32
MVKTELLRDRYERIEIAGQGGEAEVIRALDHLHGRQVALKLRPAGDDASRGRLLSEARVLLSLTPHPGLPLVREDFFVDDQYVIAMDWIDGTDLGAVIGAEGRRGLDPALAIGHLEQAAEALEHLHGHDPPVVHGDVKPANLILTAAGRIVLVDFGLSSTPGDEARRAGTSGYVAPEVAAGSTPTSAADIYALAATAVALLAGDAPSGGAPTWGAIEPERVAALERIVRPNLATDPERRDASAASFVARLRQWWGADLPAGEVTLVMADAEGSAEGEDAVDELVRVQAGHRVSPSDDGPHVVAFSSGEDGFETARALAEGGARVGVATGDAVPRAGAYVGELAEAAARRLALADPRQVVLDDASAKQVEDRLPRDLALAEVRDGMGEAEPSWLLVGPGLAVPPHANVCPYRGLMAFQTEDGDLFFGREEIVERAVGEMLESGFLAIVGPSGSGKSSLARAGLVPTFLRAREGVAAVITPGGDPEGSLAGAVTARPSVVVVDQLEEAFTLCPDDAARDRFFAALVDLHESGSSAVAVTLRADFYGRCAEDPRLAALVAAHQRLLGPMQPDELRRAIEGPARVAGLRMEPGLIETLLGDVAGEPGGLPLVSHALYESWLRRDGRVLTIEGYLAAGGVRGAIAHTAEQVYQDCSPDERVVMRRTLLLLVELGEGTDDTRRRVPRSELLPGDEVVLERLARSRLVVVGDDSAEIAHEAVIRVWPRLREWLKEDREELQTRRQLSTAARTWDAEGRDEAGVYRGARLAAALELRDGEYPLTTGERDFLGASQDVQDRELTTARRRARRLRVLLAIVAAALVLAVIAGAFALVQRGSARQTATVAQAGRLAAQSRELGARRPDLGLLLALEAGRLDDSVDTRGALLTALERGSRIRAWLQGFDSPVVGTAFSPNGALLAATTIEGTTLYDTRTWTSAGPPLRSSQGGYSGVDFSPDGRTLAIAGGEGRVELWDVATRKALRELTDPAATPESPALSTVRYSPDGAVIAAGPVETNHVTLWESATGRVLGRPITVKPPGSGGAQRISFSPDSKRIAVPGAPGSVGIWEVATGRRVGEPLAIGDEDVSAAIFADGGRTLIASDDGGSVSMLDVATGRPIGPPLSAADESADSIALSPDGRLVAVATFGGSVVVWNTKTGEPYGSPLTVDTSPVNEVAFSSDGRFLVSAHHGAAVVWDMRGEQAIGKPLDGGIDLTTDVSFSSDGTRLVAGQYDGDVVEYDTATRRQARLLDTDSIVTSVAVGPDGNIAVGTIDGRVRLVDPVSKAAADLPLGARGAAVWQVAFSPDGRLLAVAVDPNGGGDGFYAQRRKGEVQLWDVGSRNRVGRTIAPGAGTVFAVAFNRDGRLLATGSGGRLDLWDVATQAHRGKPMRVSDDGILSVAFDPSGQLVAGGGATGPARVWRVSDQRPAFPPLTGHTGFITGAAFDPSATFLATTTHLGATRLWDPATGLGYGDELVGSPRWLGPRAPSIDVPFLGLRNAFSPDGKLLAVTGVETLGMVWDVDPTLWRERACAIAGRNLSPEEWALHLPSGTAYRATCPEWPTG